MSAVVPPASNELQAEAFKRLYPNEYYAKFISKSLRPDGRPLGGARATTIGIHPLESTSSSALVKIGNTTAMAGIKLQVPAQIATVHHGQASILQMWSDGACVCSTLRSAAISL